MTNYFLHIGLHKTGTKFFQHKVFPNLPENGFLYNPPKLTQLLCDLLKAEEGDLEIVREAIRAEKEALEKGTDKTVIISREIMSGDLFSLYQDFDQTSERLGSVLPEAKVVCFLRFQADWIVSCFRETVHEHHYQDITQFLGFAQEKNDAFVSNDYKSLDLCKIVRNLYENFGKEGVHLFFFENFKKNKEVIVQQISQLFGTEPIPITRDNDPIPNRGYSAFAIKLSIYRYNLLRCIGLSGTLIHRPITFFGSKSIPAGFEELSVLPKDRYWHDGFLRDNEEVRSPNYPRLTFGEKLRKEFSWRNFIKNRLDKIFYWDWDLLEGHRQEIEDYYRIKNQELLVFFASDDIPAKYL